MFVMKLWAILNQSSSLTPSTFMSSTASLELFNEVGELLGSHKKTDNNLKTRHQRKQKQTNTTAVN